MTVLFVQINAKPVKIPLKTAKNVPTKTSYLLSVHHNIRKELISLN